MHTLTHTRTRARARARARTAQVDALHGWVLAAEYAWSAWDEAPYKVELQRQLVDLLEAAGAI